MGEEKREDGGGEEGRKLGGGRRGEGKNGEIVFQGGDTLIWKRIKPLNETDVGVAHALHVFHPSKTLKDTTTVT